MKNYFLFIAIVFVGLFVSCKKEEAEKPKVTYETTSKAKPEVVSDANQIEVADLPINMEGTNFLIHPIGVMSGNKKGIKSSYDSEQGFTVSNYGEYQITGTRIWDSARLLRTGMYRCRQMQCVSFGIDKPLSIGRGGAILLDDENAYNRLIRQRYDGRDLSIMPWQDQKIFEIGYHYKPTIEEAQRGLELLPNVDQEPKYKEYPDLREITIIS